MILSTTFEEGRPSWYQDLKMSQTPLEEVAELPATTTPIGTPAQSQQLPFEQPPKAKGCRRLILGLQRISSSPSLAKMGRSPSSNYRSGGKGSMSCISFSASGAIAQDSSYSTSYSAQTTPGFATTQSCGASPPVLTLQSPDDGHRIRIVTEPVNLNSISSTIGLPGDIRLLHRENQLAATPEVAKDAGDYFSSKPLVRVKQRQKRGNFDFWGELPHEIKIAVLRLLQPKEIVKCSMVSRAWYKLCFDGQLWANVDTEGYYREIPSASLVKIITAAGPFVRDLNLRGCEQLKERWGSEGKKMSEACKNLEHFSLEGCRIDQASVHFFLMRNPRLVHVNLSGLRTLTNHAMKILAKTCQQLEYLNVSWCQGIDTFGLHKVVEGCPKLKDLRTGEIRGFNDKDFLQAIFSRNTLERLILSHCDDLDDDSLIILLQGTDPEIDPLTSRALVPPRKFRHLDFTQCNRLTDKGVQALAYHVPDLTGLQLSKCQALTDDALTTLLESTPQLTHLDLDELDDLSNTTLINISKSPCAQYLQHLNISYCESLGDTGVLPLLKYCSQLRSLVCDNTRVSDLTLSEAAAQMRMRDRSTASSLPVTGFRLIVFDCQNVTWTGVSEILSRNSEPKRSEIIQLKCFYGYQDTVKEHTKRVLRGDSAAARRLERKWADYMRAGEEAGAGGAGARRRRRRLREAALVHADEEDGGPRAGRRRARSGNCVVM